MFTIGRSARVLVGSLAVLALTGCTSAPTTVPSASAPNPSASSTPTAADTSAPNLTVDITIAGGKVTPSGEKLDATVGSTVTFNVTSDEDDEIHAHTGGDGYELEVKAGQTTTGSVTLTSPGSFEVESHHLEKVIVILNAR